MCEHEQPKDLSAAEGSPPLLAVVMPVFNEQASVRKVELEWFQEIENLTEEFVCFGVNDESIDETLIILQRLRDLLGPRIPTSTLRLRDYCFPGCPFGFHSPQLSLIFAYFATFCGHICST